MNFLAALQALAATGAFTTRAFLPAFVVALVARFPQLVNWLPLVPEQPVALSTSLQWLSSDWCLVVLGVLALLESLASRQSDVREFWREAEPWVKGLVAAVIAFGLLDAESSEVLRRIAASPPMVGLLSGDWRAAALMMALVLGIGVVALAQLRSRLLVHLHDFDQDDHFGLGRLLAWVEDAWAGCGMLLALLAPLLAILASCAALGLMALGMREAERRADAKRQPCPACGHRMRAEAAACAACATTSAPTAEPTSRWWPDRWWDMSPLGARSRALELLALGRCPTCAERRSATELLEGAQHGCGWPAHAQERGVPGLQWAAELDQHLQSRLMRLLLPVGVFGLFPLAGAIAAIVLGRLRLVAPARRYLPIGTRVLARWQARILILLLLLPSGFPLLSAIAAPLILVVQRAVHGHALRRATIT